jgi:hypothetical protein
MTRHSLMSLAVAIFFGYASAAVPVAPAPAIRPVIPAPKAPAPAPRPITPETPETPESPNTPHSPENPDTPTPGHPQTPNTPNGSPSGNNALQQQQIQSNMGRLEEKLENVAEIVDVVKDVVEGILDDGDTSTTVVLGNPVIITVSNPMSGVTGKFQLPSDPVSFMHKD